MRIQDLIPVNVPPTLSGLVFDELTNYLGWLVGQKHLDTKICPAVIRIMVAFAELEKHGTFEAFKEALWSHIKPVPEIQHRCLTDPPEDYEINAELKKRLNEYLAKERPRLISERSD